MTRTVYIDKAWKKTRDAAFKEARKQAHEGAWFARYTGRTFHCDKDWAFEFEVGV